VSLVRSVAQANEHLIFSLELERDKSRQSTKRFFVVLRRSSHHTVGATYVLTSGALLVKNDIQAAFVKAACYAVNENRSGSRAAR
jgi:hypothetical protein